MQLPLEIVRQLPQTIGLGVAFLRRELFHCMDHILGLPCVSHLAHCQLPRRLPPRLLDQPLAPLRLELFGRGEHRAAHRSIFIEARRCVAARGGGGGGGAEGGGGEGLPEAISASARAASSSRCWNGPEASSSGCSRRLRSR